MTSRRYTDRNGAGWVIVEGSSGRFFGHPDPDAAVRYDPEPPDTDVANAEGAVASLIEKWAAANKSAVLTVTASAGGWLALVVLVVLLAMDE
jgi:hypothetical protein